MKAPLSLLLIVAVSHCGATPRGRVNGPEPMDAGPVGPMFRGSLLSGPQRPGRRGSIAGLEDAEKATIVAKHNEYRGDVSPSAANMVTMVSSSSL